MENDSAPNRSPRSFSVVGLIAVLAVVGSIGGIVLASPSLAGRTTLNVRTLVSGALGQFAPVQAKPMPQVDDDYVQLLAHTGILKL